MTLADALRRSDRRVSWALLARLPLRFARHETLAAAVACSAARCATCELRPDDIEPHPLSLLSRQRFYMVAAERRLVH